MTNLETNLHITPDGFESLIRNNLQVEEVRKALFSSVHAPTGHAAAQYDKYFGPATVTVATLDPQVFANTTTIAPEAIEAEYKAHPDNPAYRTAEKAAGRFTCCSISRPTS